MHLERRPVFPFTAIVGQEEMKLALLLNVIDPRIGGVLIMGDRGTGKSTTIRALADLLPQIEVVKGDPFNSHPRQRGLDERSSVGAPAGGRNAGKHLDPGADGGSALGGNRRPSVWHSRH
jgi:Mg-chelatase subunit ChlI